MTDAEGNFWLDDRIQKIQSVIERYGEDKFYISYSGGRDSTVLHYLVDEALPGNRIPRVYCNTGIEYGEMVKYVKALREQDDRIKVITPGVNIQQMLRTYGYPFKSKIHSDFVRQYQRGGTQRKSIDRYLDGHKGRFACPDVLRYQFTPEFTLPVSDKCCLMLKEKPLHQWAKQHEKPWVILGLMAEEGGRRTSVKCLAFGKAQNSFSPLAVMSGSWEDWYVRTRGIRLCPLYYPPYGFERTGCKGCPFALGLQQELDMMAEHFPAERRQCELVWKPVYAEYRRLGYRLRKDNGQTSLYEFD